MAASDLGLQTVSIYSENDVSSLHRYRTDEAEALGAKVAPAYLDIDRIVAIRMRIIPNYTSLVCFVICGTSSLSATQSCLVLVHTWYAGLKPPVSSMVPVFR